MLSFFQWIFIWLSISVYITYASLIRTDMDWFSSVRWRWGVKASRPDQEGNNLFFSILIFLLICFHFIIFYLSFFIYLNMKGLKKHEKISLPVEQEGREIFSCFKICLNLCDENWWFLSLGIFGLLSSSLLLYTQRFGRYVLRPFSGIFTPNSGADIEPRIEPFI